MGELSWGSRKLTSNEMLKGTPDMMILRTLLMGGSHGHTIAKIIERNSDDVPQVEQGSLHRIENLEPVSSYWGTSETIARRSSVVSKSRGECG